MRILKSIIMMLALLFSTTLSAQTITSVHGTVSDDMGPLMGAAVREVDANDRNINSTITDLNGNFTMKVSNPKNKLKITYVGMTDVILPINKSSFKIQMKSKTVHNI